MVENGPLSCHTISQKPNIHGSVNNQFLSQNPSYPFSIFFLAVAALGQD